MIRVERIYDKPEGTRILVDRLWPRGVKKETITYWVKEIGPSPDLLKWFHEDRTRYNEFAKKYAQELGTNPALEQIVQLLETHTNGVLVTAVKDIEHNHISILLQALEQQH